MAKLLQVIAIFLYVFTCILQEADCSTYHIAFLGRNHTLTSHIGSLFYPALNKDPVITSGVETCASNLSSFNVTGTSFMEVLINAAGCTQLVPNGSQIKATGIKIESSEEFVLHVYQTDNLGKNEGYLAIPDEHLGNEYYVITYCTLGGLCQFAVAGITNGTRVNVIFPNNVTVSSVCVGSIQLPDSAPSGSPVPFEINEFEVLHFESENDLTGTYISSDNYVSVFAGARDIPTSSASTTAYLVEQLPPVQKWGYSFVAAPNYFNNVGDIIKIVTQSDDTVVEISGFSPFKIPNKGGFTERRIDWQMHSHIETSNPVLIVQVMSIDIYNESSDVTGTPSMVLVPHVEQWTASETPFYCSPTVGNQTLISVVTDTSDSFSVPILPSPTLYYSPWTVVDGTDFSVQMFEPVTAETTIYGPSRSNYGYCDGSSALLLNANWTWESEACVQTVVSPGDNVDNDCDGQVDEDICQEDDLVTSFTSTQSNASDVTYKSMTTRGTHYFNLTIKTCDVAMVTLQTNGETVTSVNIQISPSSVVAEFCSPDCLPATVKARAESNCDIPHPFLIEWSSNLIVYTESSTYVWYTNALTGIDYDSLTLSAFAGTAEFNIYMTEKDCKKVPRGFPDTLGSNFILPVHESDLGFFAILSTHANLSGTVTIQLDVNNGLGTIQLQGNQSLSFTESDVTQNYYDKITVTAVGGEIAVFLIRSINSGTASEGPILPTDILGTSYYIYEHSHTTSGMCPTYALYDTSQNVCLYVSLFIVDTGNQYGRFLQKTVSNASGEMKQDTEDAPIQDAFLFF
ncbi:uncharacterized protein LOC123541181 [Mercenaria mercenaria]|uniref:uncharacterized protein LOC123541181 n=1 Tax=Mercenaria mercenaria TaxID=6596 RepID=UPI00234F520F|nr:uncharacterized protein LOC123541181 [Mercenaria mercenaria]